MPSRCVPYAMLNIWTAGAAGVIDDPGWAAYSAMAAEWQLWWGPWAYPYGAADSNSHIGGIRAWKLGKRTVVTPRPWFYPWHMLSDDWTASAGIWEEATSMVAANDRKILHCIDNAGTLTSNFSLPEAPSFVVEFEPMASPHGYDAVGNPPNLQVTWGDPGGVLYTITVDSAGDLYISSWDGAITSIWGAKSTGWKYPAAAHGTGKVESLLELAVLHLAGGIVVIANSGEEIFFEDPSGAPIVPGEGPLSISYRGGSCNLAVYGILGPTPDLSDSTILTIESPIVTTDLVRGFEPTVEGWYYVPAPTAPDVAPGISIDNVDLSGTDTVQVSVTFQWGYTQMGVAQADFLYAYCFGFFPELHGVQVRFDPTVTPPAGAPIERYSGRLERVSINLPDEGDQSDATFDGVWFTQESGGFVDALYGNLADLSIGWKYVSPPGIDTMTPIMSGYIAELESKQESPHRVRVHGTLVDISSGVRQIEIDENWPVMDDWDGEVAALYVLRKCGWPSSRANFATCNEATRGYRLSVGWPESPLWRGAAGSMAWEFLGRILRYFGQEIAMASNGMAYSRAIMYWSANSHTYSLITALEGALQRKNMFGFTGVEVRGEDLLGNVLVARRPDLTLEAARGYRRLERFEDAGLLGQVDVDDIADIMFACLFCRMSDVVRARIVPPAPIPPRRDTVVLTGGSFGVSTLVAVLGILGMQIEWGPRLPDCSVTLHVVQQHV